MWNIGHCGYTHLNNCLNRNGWEITRRYVGGSRLSLHNIITRMADMDVIFALAHLEGVSPVAVSLRKDIPAAGTPEADRILGVTNVD